MFFLQIKRTIFKWVIDKVRDQRSHFPFIRNKFFLNLEESGLKGRACLYVFVKENECLSPCERQHTYVL